MENNERYFADDRELGMGRPITRRDFLNGVAVGSSAALAHMLGPMDLYAAAQDNPGCYPPCSPACAIATMGLMKSPTLCATECF